MFASIIRSRNSWPKNNSKLSNPKILAKDSLHLVLTLILFAQTFVWAGRKLEISYSTYTLMLSGLTTSRSISLRPRLSNVEFSLTNSISGKKGNLGHGWNSLTRLILWQCSPIVLVAIHLLGSSGTIPFQTQDLELSTLVMSTGSQPEASTFLTNIPSEPNNLKEGTMT